jgi:hypothetical protein
MHPCICTNFPLSVLIYQIKSRKIPCASGLLYWNVCQMACMHMNGHSDIIIKLYTTCCGRGSLCMHDKMLWERDLTASVFCMNLPNEGSWSYNEPMNPIERSWS